ncbi:hypothetical protein GLOIN_2v1498288 [Rhizophagus irregularis DAOM 181602=DAOM 197198]|uniref:Uncharacterized protein n=1 Tax=Rhizophagus irregularis (strain DAOM 181602 / DAOM 197198 / MUCL 43194) TaxID=747089 RepID=A0A2P4QXL8_RHIID|nr:hypothetical protein GLOIN_2v1498288 [Rhizophagus irregularis DAOM 181602=DAOM 197198]POG82404.1 hypothetical protein GLOIN_2v1498288 [Rhizophagus irregularis DAOM 181602=DAOM 197198]|eukprot:XP_025189270.1 hypothetical protein GLOIN_2v1498288 [Rhizophagus irregularis DAOM 181602=DAOM 197198]
MICITHVTCITFQFFYCALYYSHDLYYSRDLPQYNLILFTHICNRTEDHKPNCSNTYHYTNNI